MHSACAKSKLWGKCKTEKSEIFCNNIKMHATSKNRIRGFFSLFVDVVPNRNLAQMRSVCKSVNNATKENVIALWVSPFVNIAQSKQQQHYVLHIRCYSTQRRFRSLCTMLARSTHLFSAFLFANVTHYDEYQADAVRIYTKTKR